MKKSHLIIVLSLLFMSCNLTDSLERVQKINEDLKQHFKHQYINVVIGFGTNEEDNNIQVTFYNYNIESIEYQELKDTSKEVAKRLNSKYPEFKNKTYIEVRFTEESKSDDNDSFISFKHNN